MKHFQNILEDLKSKTRQCYLFLDLWIYYLKNNILFKD